MSKKSSSAHEATVDDLVDDLKAVVRDAEALLRATEGHAGEKIAEVRARAEASLESAKERLKDAGNEFGERARSAARTTDAYVRENPWTAIAIAVGIGFLIGSETRRR